MSKEQYTLYDKFKNSLDKYKSAYINYKTNPSDEKENHYFVSKRSLQNIYDKLISSNSINESSQITDINNVDQLSYNKKKQSLNHLKTTLDNIRNDVSVGNTQLSNNRKSDFFYFLKREQMFLLAILVILIGFLIYSRYELKQSYEITKAYVKKIATTSTTTDLNSNVNSTKLNMNNIRK